MNELRGRQVVATYSILYVAARRSFTAAQQNEEGSFYELLNSLMMSAFVVEAYFNHLGAIKFKSSFEKFEKLSVWKKFKKLRLSCGFQEGGLEKAYPAVAELFNFRNKIAHGRTETNYIDATVIDEPAVTSISQLALGWRGAVSLDIAGKALNDVKTLIEELHFKSGLGKFPFLTTINGMYSITKRVDDN